MYALPRQRRNSFQNKFYCPFDQFYLRQFKRIGTPSTPNIAQINNLVLLSDRSLCIILFSPIIRISALAQRSSSSFVSFTQCSPTCGRMPLPSLSLWLGRQPCRPRLVGDRRGGGPSSVAPRSRNPPTGHRRDSPISSSLFSHGQPLCAVG